MLQAAALLTCLVLPRGLVAQRHFWQPDERVLVSDGGIITGIAAGTREVYAAAPFGVLIWDIVFKRWKPPVPLPIEMIATRPAAVAYDAAGGAIWLGTDAGDLYTSVPGFGRWDRAPVNGRGAIDAIVPWPREGVIYVHAGGEWQRLQSTSLIAEPVSPASVPAPVLSAAQPTPNDPFFRAAQGTLGLDPRLRRWTMTDVATGPEPGEYWIATAGGGVLHYDRRMDRRDWLRYGLAGAGAASVAFVAGRLWFGSDGRGVRRGVAVADPELGEWQQFDSGDGAPSGFVAEIVPAFGVLWFAASDGLYRLDTSRRPDATGGAAWTRFTGREGLPTDAARCLLPAQGHLWIGTDRGLAVLDSTGRPSPALFAGQRVARLAARHDSLFLATDRGLWVLAPGQPPGTAPAAYSTNPALRGRVNDVAVSDSATFAIVEGDLYRADGPPSGALRDAALDRIGPALRLAQQGETLWVAGPRGIARRDAQSGRWEAYTVPDDITAGPVVDVLPVGDDVWAATPAGAVRLHWRH